MNHIPHSFDIMPEVSDLSKIYVRPTRILWHNDNAECCENIIKNTDSQMLVNESGVNFAYCHIKPGGAVLIDFGRELCGGVKLFVKTIFDENGKDENKPICKFRLRFGESANEAMAELHEKGTTNDHNPRDFETSTSVMSMPEFGYTGFRFVRIDNTDVDKTLLIVTVCAYAYFRDIEYKGTFKCDDEVINKVYDTAAYTLHLCMQDYIWDGIKRDRLVWIGDMYPEISTLCAVFGDDISARKSLDLLKSNTLPDKYMNGIITYNAWWVLCHHRLYMQNGDLEYLKEQHERIVDTALLFEKHINDEGRFEPLGTWPLIDWPSNHNDKLRNSGAQALVKLMYDCAAFLLSELSDVKNAEKCKKFSEKMSKVSLPDADYKQIAALQVLAGFKDAVAENERLLSKHGANGISTFLGMFTFAAESEANDTEKALDNIKGLYGKMLDIGATSFFEDFDPAWCENAGRIDELTPKGLDDIHGDRGAYCYVGFRHSLCHGWSSGVCSYLAEYVLGVKVKKPGCKEVEISPRLGYLNHVYGTYPTPYGNIEIKSKKNADGSIKTEYSAPKEIKVILKQ